MKNDIDSAAECDQLSFPGFSRGAAQAVGDATCMDDTEGAGVSPYGLRMAAWAEEVADLVPFARPVQGGEPAPVPGKRNTAPSIASDSKVTTYWQSQKKVSRTFRQSILEMIPAASAATSEGLFIRKMLIYLMFPSWLDRANEDRTVLPKETVANLCGVVWNRNFVAERRLLAFQEATGIDLDIATWLYSRKQARTVAPSWLEGVRRAIALELRRSVPTKEKVYFDTAESCHRSARRNQDKADILARRAQSPFQVSEDDPRRPALKILACPSTAVQKKIVCQNAADAIRLAEAIVDETVCNRNLDYIGRIVDDPTQCYGIAEDSARLFTQGISMNQLNNKEHGLRDCMLRGCWELDLKAAQTCIIAVLWDVPLLKDALAGPDFWGTLLADIGLGPAHKLMLKTALYGLVYGMSIQHTRRFMAESSSAEASRRFLLHPILVAILAARKRRMRFIAKAGGVTTVYGQRVTVGSRPGMLFWHKLYQEELRSALAQEVQAVEQLLMFPALRIAGERQEQGLVLMNYLHDGMAVYHRDRSRVESIMREMAEAVEKEALEHGYQVRAEIKEIKK